MLLRLSPCRPRTGLVFLYRDRTGAVRRRSHTAMALGDDDGELEVEVVSKKGTPMG